MKNWFRFSEWWDSKIAFLFGLVYLFAIHRSIDFRGSAVNVLFLLSWMCLAAALGYYINDVFDLKKDTATAKRNFSVHHSVYQKILICIILIGMIYLTWYCLNENIVTLVLITSQIILFLLYSIPVSRLKEMPIAGPICDSIYASVIPGVMVYLTIDNPQEISWLCIVFGVWLFMAGIRNIISHHIDDFTNDNISGTKTSAVALGKMKMKRLVNYIISPIEVGFFLAFLILLQGSIAFVAVGFVIYVIWVFNRELIFVKANRHNWSPEKQDAYNFIGGVLLNEFYENWFPLICLMTLIWHNYILWPLLIVHIILFRSNIVEFGKDYLILKNLILAKAFWTSVSVGYSLAGIIKRWVCFLYYEIFGRIKHYIYWKIYIPLSGKDE